jgi:DNA-binding FrmR family transcriptional regulator
MQLSSTLVKTAKGLEEIDKRTHKLSGRLRAVMFMIDGQRTVGALLDQAGSMAAQLETQLKELLAQNFISEVLSPDESVVVETVAKPVTQIVPTSARTTPTPTPATATSTAPKPSPPVVNAAKKAEPIVAAPKRAQESITTVKERLSKMLAETMGMRAMFITSQLNGLQSHDELERFIDDTARANATTTGAKAAEEWRVKARVLAGYEN